jgi:hypothetical protein
LRSSDRAVQGKPLEFDVLLAAVIELSEWVDLAVANLRAVYAATALLERVRRVGFTSAGDA